MIRFLFRVLSLFALAVAVIMAVVDATRSVAASGIVMTPLLESWQAASPGTLDTVRASIREDLDPWAWDTVFATVLGQPGFLVFGVLALILYTIGYRRRRRRHSAAFEP